MPTIRDRLSAAYRGFREPGMSYEERSTLPRLSPPMPRNPRHRYAVLRMQKENTIYRELRSILRQGTPKDYERIRGIENPALQAVDFHVMHVFPGSLAEALPFDIPPDDALRIAAERVMAWSWFGRQKDRLVDVAATYGDAFIRSYSTDSRVGVEVVMPEDVTDFDEDAQGNIVYIRTDVAVKTERPEDPPEFITEVWSKEDDTYEWFRHEKGLSAKLEELPTGAADEAQERYYAAPISSFGHDFIPFTRASFSTLCGPSVRSAGVFEAHREAIDELLRNGTVLRDRYFRHGKPLWQSVTALEKPVDYVEQIAREATEGDARKLQSARMPDEEPFVKNPQGTRLEALIPSIDWSAGLAQIEDSRMALERSMSELRFFRGHDSGDPSGAAMEKHQAPAIRRAASARGNFEEAITKALKMCLTMGQTRRLFPGIPDFGSYATGDFDGLTFTPRPIIPETETQKMAVATGQAEMYAALKNVSPELLRLRLIEDGYEEDVAARIASSGGEPSLRQILSGGGISGGGNLIA